MLQKGTRNSVVGGGSGVHQVCESYFIKAMLDLATAAGQPPESLADSPFFSKNTTFQSYIPSRKAHLDLGQNWKAPLPHNEKERF